jgi:hypothetical protein
MSFTIETTTKDQSGTTVYTVTVTLPGEHPVSRTFHSKADAERFEAQERSRLMDDRDLAFISDDKIPESIRASYTQMLSKQKEIQEANKIEDQRIKLEARKFAWNTPIVAALAGLITLTATQLFSIYTSRVGEEYSHVGAGQIGATKQRAAPSTRA